MPLKLLTEGQGVAFADDEDGELWRIEVSDKGLVAITSTPFGLSRNSFGVRELGQALDCVGCHWAVAKRAAEMLGDLLPMPDSNRDRVLAAVGRVTKTGPQIARIGGCSRSTAGRYLKEARERGWIHWFGESGWYKAPLPKPIHYTSLISKIIHMGFDVDKAVNELLLWWTRRPLEITGYIHWIDPYPPIPRLVIFEGVAGTRNCRALGTFDLVDGMSLKRYIEQTLLKVATELAQGDRRWP
jgi:hypothetical protein